MLVKVFQLHFCLISRMTSIFMVSFLLCFAYGHATFLCMLTEYTMYVEMEECSHCIAINTTICSGYCSTKVLSVMTDHFNICMYGNPTPKKTSNCKPEGDQIYWLPNAWGCTQFQCAKNHDLSFSSLPWLPAGISKSAKTVVQILLKIQSC